MDLGDLGRNHKPRDFEEFVLGDFPVRDRLARHRRIAQSTVDIRRLLDAATELVHEEVVLAGEQVVEEAQAYRPVVREGRRFLASPCGVDWIASLELGQVALLQAKLSSELRFS